MFRNFWYGVWIVMAVNILVKHSATGINFNNSDFIHHSSLLQKSNKTKVNDHIIMGYKKIDETSSIYGCSVKESFKYDSKNSHAYEEQHVVFVKSKSVKKVFIDIKDIFHNSLPQKLISTVKPLYKLFFLSVQAIEWVVSYNSTIANYEFYVSSESIIKTFKNVQILPSDELTFPLTISSGKTYHPVQIKAKLCNAVYGVYKCKINSFLRLNNVSFLQITFGKFNSTAIETKKCVPNKMIGNISQVRAYSLNLLPPTDLSLANLSRRSTHLFVVDLSNTTRNRTVDLELDFISHLFVKSKLLLVLHSSSPVQWRIYEGSGLNISFHINVLISDGSSINADNLSFNETGKILINSMPDQIEGKTLLETVRSIYNLSVNSYVKFSNQPDLIKIAPYHETGRLSKVKWKEIPENLIMLLHIYFEITSSGSFLNISKQTFEAFELQPSDIVPGDGHCSMFDINNHVVYGDLSNCGLKRASVNEFNITVTVKGLSTILRMHFPITKPSVDLYNGSSSSKSFSKRLISSQNATLIVLVHTAASKKFKTDTVLERCYLISHDASVKYLLIKDNCPVSKDIKMMTGTLLDTSRFVNFSINVNSQLSLPVNHTYNLTCVMYRCFTRVVSPLAVLPQCLSEPGDAESCRDISESKPARLFNESISIEAFTYALNDSTEPESSSLFPVILVVTSCCLCFIASVLLLVLVYYRRRALKRRSHLKANYTRSKPIPNGKARNGIVELRSSTQHSSLNNRQCNYASVPTSDDLKHVTSANHPQYCKSDADKICSPSKESSISDEVS